MVTAPTDIYDDVVQKEIVEHKDSVYRLSSEGKVVKDYLRGR